MTNQPIANVRALTVRAADGTRLLHDVDLELRSGTVTAVVGASGAGKSTLALSLLGHLGPGLRVSAGSVEVAGHDPFTRRGRRALRGRITGYLPQDPAAALDPRRRIGAQLLTAARIAHPGENGTERVRQAIAAVALEPELLQRHPGAISGGQAQRALLAWTLVTRPQLLILDEPTSGLDAATAARVHRSFTTLPWRPAVLVITHDRELVAGAADRLLELSEGRWTRPQVSPPQLLSGPVPAGGGPLTLRVENLSLHRQLLTDVSFGLAAGEILAVQGASGSGKTTLARALAGFAPPAAGVLRLDDEPISWSARRRRSFIAYVGQDARAALNPYESVGRTLDRARAAALGAGRAAPADPRLLLEHFGLPDEVLGRRPDELSGGQRHRLALVRALAAAPRVLVADETLAALDRDTTGQVLAALRTWRETQGTPMVLITHSARVAATADRVLTISGGRLR